MKRTHPNPGPGAGGVQLRGLRKSYGHVQAVRGIDADIPAGATVALLGPNGAGKSTTIDLLLGLARPDAGTVTVCGMDPSDAVTSGRVGGMLQTGALIQNLKVRELVTMVASLYPSPMAVDEVLAITDTAELGDRDTSKLSGGQTQRVRFALSLVGNPDLLLLDEPTASLDVEGRRELWTVVREVAGRGTTILFATHNLEEADAYADRVILLANGTVVADGPTTEIKARVSGRTIRTTLPGVATSDLAGLPGVAGVERHGDGVAIASSDSDRALRALLDAYPDARDVEVRGAGLEEAFIELTAEADRLEGTTR